MPIRIIHHGPASPRRHFRRLNQPRPSILQEAHHVIEASHLKPQPHGRGAIGTVCAWVNLKCARAGLRGNMREAVAVLVLIEGEAEQAIKLCRAFDIW